MRTDRAALLAQRRVTEGDVIVVRPAPPRRAAAAAPVTEAGRVPDAGQGRETGPGWEGRQETPEAAEHNVYEFGTWRLVPADGLSGR
jgi:hypothetical protein